MTKNKYSIAVVLTGLVMTAGLIGYAIFHERYLDAVAISCIGPVLAWFALGAGNSKKPKP